VFNNPEHYQEPHIFDPERYLETPGHKAEMDPTLLAFSVGIGRRFCPGYHLAQAFIFITICQILSNFDIDPPKDVNGIERIPPADFKTGHISYVMTKACFETTYFSLFIRVPLEFKCIIKPRSYEKARFLHDMALVLGST